MARQKARQVGTAGLVTRYSSGIVMRTCRRCHQADTPPSWRAALRDARAHARDHDATDARDVNTPWGVPAHELPPTRRLPLRRLANLALVLALAALLFFLVVANAASHAAPAPTAPPASIASTTAAAPEGYVPTPAGPPATDADGRWLPGPDQASAPAAPDAGGGR